MRLKKLLAVILATLFVLSLAGCKGKDTAENSGQPDVQSQPAKATLKLLYCSNDTFNPYTLTTKVNEELCLLLYDPLIKLDNNFEVQFVLASSAVQDGNNWTLQLKDVSFTDGSKLSGDDVIYSFNLAKQCGRYQASLGHIASVSTLGNSVTFVLNYFDPYFINVLSFPIIKSGSDNITDSDSVLLPPIGTGRFYLNEQKNGLIENAGHFDKSIGFSSVSLIDAPDSESASHYVESGATDFYFDNSTDSKIVRMSGNKLSVNTNNLIYLGLNGHDAHLSNRLFRFAVSAALDRQKLLTAGCYGNAVAATGPFNPVWKQVESYQTTETTANIKIAIENLEKIGYNKKSGDIYYRNQKGDVLSLTLLINGDNSAKHAMAEVMQNQLKAVGIKLEINALPYEQYLHYLNNGWFQLYLGEVSLSNNFDIAPLVLEGGSCAYGVVDAVSDEQSISMADIIGRYRSGEIAISDVIIAVQSRMPFIPICYRSGVLFSNSAIKGVNTACNDDIFSSLSTAYIG